jgi:hypothetical protein
MAVLPLVRDLVDVAVGEVFIWQKQSQNIILEFSYEIGYVGRMAALAQNRPGWHLRVGLRQMDWQ